MEELYKKYRPTSLERVVGNESAVSCLSGMLSENKLPHTIMFTGPSGCGKTTLARILRDQLGCSSSDYTEVDAADLRGIDMVREIRSTMNLYPFNGPCKMWVIDECHKLTADAQNAFLKALEDTPPHVYFVLCTTDPEKVIKTIRNRSTTIQLESLDEEEMVKLIKRICRLEKKKLEDEEILDLIVKAADGSPRRALVILDQVLNMEEEDREGAIQAIKQVEDRSDELCKELLKANVNWGTVAGILKTVPKDVDPEGIRRQVLGYMSAVMLNAKGDTVDRAAWVVTCFEDAFFSSGKAGLINASYSAVKGG